MAKKRNIEVVTEATVGCSRSFTHFGYIGYFPNSDTYIFSNRDLLHTYGVTNGLIFPAVLKGNAERILFKTEEQAAKAVRHYLKVCKNKFRKGEELEFVRAIRFDIGIRDITDEKVNMPS